MSDRLNASALLISIDLITLLSSEKLLLINGKGGEEEGIGAVEVLLSGLGVRRGRSKEDGGVRRKGARGCRS